MVCERRGRIRNNEEGWEGRGRERGPVTSNERMFRKKTEHIFLILTRSTSSDFRSKRDKENTPERKATGSGG